MKIDCTYQITPEHRARAQAAVQKLKGISSSDFFRVPQMFEMFESCQARGLQLQKFRTLGVLGIGGSSLGPKVIYETLASDRQLEVFENVDPVAFERRLKKIDLETTHWLVISKSGKTLETLSQLSLLVERYRSLGAELIEHFTVISDPVQNPLTDWALAKDIVTLAIPLKVGGRFSVLTPVGMVPAAYLGHAVETFREGAQDACVDSEITVEAVAQTLASFERGEWITVFWCYSDLLGQLGNWIQQLWAESLAKSKTKNGQNAPRVSTPLPLVGANDQHSILQQVMEGARDKFIWFIGAGDVENSGHAMREVIGLPKFLNGQTLGKILSAERRATQKALQSQGIHSLNLMVAELNPRSLGYLFQFFENVVAALGEALEIDAFDQPGVELGKRLAYEILEKQCD